MTPRAPAMAPDERRASIIAATIPLLRDKGRAVSTREIAKAAGIAEGTIFRVFENKDELILACVHDAFDTTALRRELEAVDASLPLRERLTAAVEMMQERLKGVIALITVLQSNGRPVHRPSGREAIRRRREGAAEVDAAIEALIGQDAASLRIPVANFIGYLRMLTLSSVHPMLDSPDATASELVDVVLEGALARPDGSTRRASGARSSTSRISGPRISRGKK